MAARWTEAQLDAIRARRGTVLVSAAAGSGKTAVLVERVIERLTDEENPTDADRLLVVTFTKAAAAEMRERIERRLLEMIRNDPQNGRLRRQQLLLQQAQICTVDSFCSAIVREFFYLIGVSPDFSVVSDKQQEELMDEAVTQVLNEMYAEEDFQRLSDAVSGDKNDKRLIETILKLFTYTRSHPFPEKWLREMTAAFAPNVPIAETVWGKKALEHAKQVMEFARRLSEDTYALIEDHADLLKAYGDTLQADIKLIDGLIMTAEKQEWDLLTVALNGLSFERMKAYRGADPR